MSEKIVFNGITYDSLEQMPQMERKAYEAIRGMFADKDGDGIPDLFGGGTVVNVKNARPQIIFEGKWYESAEELPPEAQARYRAAMGMLDADGNGIPDIVEERLGLMVETGDEPQPDWLQSSIGMGSDRISNPAISPAIHNARNIEPEGINWRAVMISAVLVGLVFLGAVTLWFYLAQ